MLIIIVGYKASNGLESSPEWNFARKTWGGSHLTCRLLPEMQEEEDMSFDSWLLYSHINI